MHRVKSCFYERATPTCKTIHNVDFRRKEFAGDEAQRIAAKLDVPKRLYDMV
jgi:hypothetical protein